MRYTAHTLNDKGGFVSGSYNRDRHDRLRIKALGMIEESITNDSKKPSNDIIAKVSKVVNDLASDKEVTVTEIDDAIKSFSPVLHAVVQKESVKSNVGKTWKAYSDKASGDQVAAKAKVDERNKAEMAQRVDAQAKADEKAKKYAKDNESKFNDVDEEAARTAELTQRKEEMDKKHGGKLASLKRIAKSAYKGKKGPTNNKQAAAQAVSYYEMAIETDDLQQLSDAGEIFLGKTDGYIDKDAKTGELKATKANVEAFRAKLVDAILTRGLESARRPPNLAGDNVFGGKGLKSQFGNVDGQPSQMAEGLAPIAKQKEQAAQAEVDTAAEAEAARRTLRTSKPKPFTPGKTVLAQSGSLDGVESTTTATAKVGEKPKVKRTMPKISETKSDKKPISVSSNLQNTKTVKQKWKSSLLKLRDLSKDFPAARKLLDDIVEASKDDADWQNRMVGNERDGQVTNAEVVILHVEQLLADEIGGFDTDVQYDIDLEDGEVSGDGIRKDNVVGDAATVSDPTDKTMSPREREAASKGFASQVRDLLSQLDKAWVGPKAIAGIKAFIIKTYFDGDATAFEAFADAGKSNHPYRIVNPKSGKSKSAINSEGLVFSLMRKHLGVSRKAVTQEFLDKHTPEQLKEFFDGKKPFPDSAFGPDKNPSRVFVPNTIAKPIGKKAKTVYVEYDNLGAVNSKSTGKVRILEDDSNTGDGTSYDLNSFGKLWNAFRETQDKINEELATYELFKDAETKRNRKRATDAMNNYRKLSIESDERAHTINVILELFAQKEESRLKNEGLPVHKQISDAANYTEDNLALEAVQREAKLGRRDARVLEQETLNKLERLGEKKPAEAIQHMIELGIFAEGHVVGELPKRSVTIQLSQLANSTKFGLKNGTIKENETITAGGKKFSVPALVKMFAQMNNPDFRTSQENRLAAMSSTSERDGGDGSNNEGSADGMNLNLVLQDALYDAVGALNENGYAFDMGKLPDRTIVYSQESVTESRNSALKDVTLGDLKKRLESRKEYIDGEYENESLYENLGFLSDEDGGRVSDEIMGEVGADMPMSPNRGLKREESMHDSLNKGYYDSTGPKATDAVLTEAQKLVDEENAYMENKLRDTRASNRKGKNKDGARVLRQSKMKVKRIINHRKQARGALFKILEMTKTRLGKFHPELEAFAAKFSLNRLTYGERLTAQTNKLFANEKALERGVRDMEEGRDTEEAKIYRQAIKNVEKFVQKFDPSFKAPDGAIINLDVGNIDNNRAGFLEILREGGIKDPERYLESMFNGKGAPEFASDLGGVAKPTRRKLVELKAVLPKLRQAGFINNDSVSAMTQYMYAAGSYAAMYEASDGGALLRRVNEEIHPAHKGEYSKLMAGLTGSNAFGTHRYLRRFNSVAMAFQTATVLWFAGVASIPELVSTMTRAKFSIDGMGEEVKGLMKGKSRDEMRQFAVDMNISTAEAMEHSLHALNSMDAMTTGRVAQKVNKFVFTWNGQMWLTELNRAFAASMGKRFIEYHVAGNDPKSDRFLAELQIDRATALKAMDENNKDMRAQEDYELAIHRFVNQAVTNPTSGQLPLIATDPRFAVITSLKKFFYGFYDNVHKSIYRDFVQSREHGDEKRVIANTALTVALVLPLAAMSEVLRELIKYPLGRPNGYERSAGDFALSVVGNTGGLGVLQMAQLPMEMHEYGRNPFITFMGPTVGYAWDAARGQTTLARHIPLANQLPYARQPVNQFWKDMKGLVLDE